MQNVDGIKKISKQELSRRREVILGMIGEDKQDTQKRKNDVEKTKKETVKKIKKIDIVAAEIRDREILKRQWREGLDEQYFNNQKDNNKTKDEVKHILNIQKQKGAKKSYAVFKKKVIGKKAVTKKKKTKNKVNKIEPKKRKKRSKNFLSKNINKISGFVGVLKSVKFALFVIVASILVGIIFYLAEMLVLVNFKPDNKFFRGLESVLPVPAIIIGDKFIDIYKFIDKQNENADNDKENFVVNNLIEDVIVQEYLQKYNLTNREDLNDFVVFDNEINKVGLNRINKIKEMIEDGQNFIDVANKYGERLDQIDIDKDSIGTCEYGNEVSNLNIGELSDVVTTNKGYYIFRCYENEKEHISLSYVFISAISFDEYLSNPLGDIPFVSFVEL